MNKGKDLTIKINGNEITANQKVLRVISDSLMNGGVKMNLKNVFVNPKNYRFPEVNDHKYIEKIKNEVEEENKNEHLFRVLESALDRQYQQVDYLYDHNCEFLESYHNDSDNSDDYEEIEEKRVALLISRIGLLKNIIFSYRKIIQHKLSY